MKKFLLLPILALSLVSCGEKEKKFDDNIVFYNEDSYWINGYQYEGYSEKGSAVFSDFQFVFFEDKKSQLSYTIDFYYSNLVSGVNYECKEKITLNYTDYVIDYNDVYFYGDYIPSEFTFEYITNTGMNIFIRDKQVLMYKR